MIKFIKTLTEQEKQHNFVEKIEFQLSDEIKIDDNENGVPGLQTEFERFCMAIGYSPDLFKEDE